MILIDLFLYIIICAGFFSLYRIIKGPSIADRMVAIDIFGIIVVGICAILTIKTNEKFIINVGFAWLLLSFLGTTALAKYLTGAKLDE